MVTAKAINGILPTHVKKNLMTKSRMHITRQVYPLTLINKSPIYFARNFFTVNNLPGHFYSFQYCVNGFINSHTFHFFFRNKN
jgi:hypothetical protein